MAMDSEYCLRSTLPSILWFACAVRACIYIAAHYHAINILLLSINSFLINGTKGKSTEVG